ncbi:lactose ABC transporter membrane protein [Hydrogenoanaerobacterium saccharovorans]|uniref:Lactose ABC transporter membrane protein n=1 Tax=Hydrogenoanaerobacterium saccharovorans TaxID=474960 RepID=A0A1H7YUF1_9FIRM|nr:sugar ABC transporter permease [Hydrogenoanaerobacterium saccharovorans]RPF49041.1 lactose ABC transporter membrane protein [Hydrogenoanaerobacterium saccharovorans]SEM49008.1 lactose ABC transporter membrane protein [Hydrogenoanaerobacterium saccharovorans]
MNKKENRSGWGFVSIAAICILIFSFYPMLQSLITSFQSGMGVNLQFAGTTNYKRLFTDPQFLAALKNTVTYLIVQVPIMTILALFIAVLLNDNQLKFKGLFRTAIFLPCVTSLVAYSVLFKSLFAQDGIFNQFLMTLRIIQQPIQWITDPFWAKVAIIIAVTWRWTGYNMIFYLSALQNIDPSIYEAAELDGATGFTKFFRITAPLLKPIILFTTIMSTNGTLQIFDEIVNLTNGGPANATLSISQYIYNLCFKYTPNFGYAAAVSYSIVVMVGLLSFIQFKVGGDKND